MATDDTFEQLIPMMSDVQQQPGFGGFHYPTDPSSTASPTVLTTNQATTVSPPQNHVGICNPDIASNVNSVNSISNTINRMCTLYQIGYYEENLGKHRKQSKKKLTWVFRVVDSDFAGHDHTVSLIWSKSTGKQEVEMDGVNVWFGRRPGSSVFEHRWTTSTMTPASSAFTQPLQLHIVSTIAPKLHENFRKHDLILNGQVFTNLPPCATTTSSDGEPVAAMGDAVQNNLRPRNSMGPMVMINNCDDAADDDDYGTNGIYGDTADGTYPASIFYLLYPDGIVHDVEL